MAVVWNYDHFVLHVCMCTNTVSRHLHTFKSVCMRILCGLQSKRPEDKSNGVVG